LAVEIGLDLGQAAGERDLAPERPAPERCAGIADHRMVVGDQERARLGRWIGHLEVSPRRRVATTKV
jgi:hypothetical protein